MILPPGPIIPPIVDFGTFNTKSVANSNVAVLVQCDHELLPFVLSVLSIQKIFSVDF